MSVICLVLEVPMDSLAATSSESMKRSSPASAFVTWLEQICLWPLLPKMATCWVVPWSTWQVPVSSPTWESLVASTLKTVKVSSWTRTGPVASCPGPRPKVGWTLKSPWTVDRFTGKAASLWNLPMCLQSWSGSKMNWCILWIWSLKNKSGWCGGEPRHLKSCA